MLSRTGRTLMSLPRLEGVASGVNTCIEMKMFDTYAAELRAL